MVFSLLQQLLWCKIQQEFVEAREVEGDAIYVDESFDGLEDDGDPGVVVGVAEAVEGLAEHQVADNVEGGPVVPGDDVLGAVAGTSGGQEAVDEEVDVDLDF